MCFFFFSSRRRHTRWTGDWSSDVCSSDLSWAGENFELPDDGSPRVQIKMWAAEELCRQIARLGGQDLDSLRASAESRSFRLVPLGVRLSFFLTNTIQQK